MKNLIARFINEEEGQDLIEYSLLAALIAVAAIVIITATGTGINAVFGKVNNSLNAAS
jgi:pilus assembly protein Flp/PilA